MSFHVLKWFDSDYEYNARYLSRFGGFAISQKEAERFKSAGEARTALDYCLYYGAGGEDDKCGYKVVRIVPRKK